MASDKSWYDRVIEKLNAQRARSEADREWFQQVCVYTSNARGNRDGERLTRDGDTATKSYKGVEVYSFTVKDGKTTITPRASRLGVKPEIIEDREQALDRMAELLARAINDPDWGETGRPNPEHPKPLYPV